MENKKFHLETIQNTICRMAKNSFLLKGWCVILVSALFTVLLSHNFKEIWITLIPILSLWYLDGYFLRQERLYRKLYDVIRIKKDSEIDYSMDTSIFKTHENSLVSALFSKTLIVFYGALLFISVISIIK